MKNLRLKIIDHAIAFLSEVGYSNFSALGVAKSMGISQSHLTHYFPTRDDLLTGMAVALTDRYVALVESWAGNANSNHEQVLKEFIDQALDDAVSEPTRSIFPGLWEAAKSNYNMNEALNLIYISSQKSLLLRLGANPEDPTSEKICSLVQLLTVLVEGTTAVYGRYGPESRYLTNLKSTTKTLLIPLILQAIKEFQE